MNGPPDTIFIRDLALRCIIGINSDERREKQDVIINVAMNCDLRKACASDKIEDSVDYKMIKKKIIRAVETSSFFLIEKLADTIAAVCLDDPRVDSTEITVDKPGALRFSRSAAVRICRSSNREETGRE
jgi:FolB domain-containing protein